MAQRPPKVPSLNPARHAGAARRFEVRSNPIFRLVFQEFTTFLRRLFGGCRCVFPATACMDTPRASTTAACRQTVGLWRLAVTTEPLKFGKRPQDCLCAPLMRELHVLVSFVFSVYTVAIFIPDCYFFDLILLVRVMSAMTAPCVRCSFSLTLERWRQPVTTKLSESGTHLWAI